MLGSHAVGEGEPAFIIAEAGLNHNGSLKLALELVDRAAEIGCSAIKFQTYRSENRVSKAVKGNKYAEELIDTEESTYAMLERLELDFEAHKKLFAHAAKRGIEIFSTPFDLESVDELEKLGVNFYKISSMDLVNLPLIRKVAATQKPLIISTGMSTLGQVEDAVNVVREEGNRNLILLHCVSSYPAAPQDMNLKVMDTLREAFGVSVGLSDHTIGTPTAMVALARGASAIERHFTLDRFMEGPDHILSSDVDEMADLVRFAQLVPIVEGRAEKVILHSETDTIEKFKKCLYAKKDIRKGQRITEAHVTVKGPGGGILPKHLDAVIGRAALRTIRADHPLRWEDV
jgi:sialic acid synthase SpsE